MAFKADELTIHVATPDDCPALAEMNRQLIDDEGELNSMTVAELERRMKDWLLIGAYTGFLFKLRGEIIGYALVNLPDMWMRHFFIRREHRRQGYGRASVALLFDRLGAKEIGLSCLLTNSPGMAFWRGFDHDVGTMKFYVRRPGSRGQSAKLPKQSAEVIIREIEERDYPGVLAIWNHEIGNGYIDAENIAAHHERFKNDDNYKAFVAELRGRVVGFIYIMHYLPWGTESGSLWIQSLAVSGEVQNMGIGTKLLGHVENYGREKGAEYITLNTGYRRTGAHAFYQRHGYSSGNWCFGKKL